MQIIKKFFAFLFILLLLLIGLTYWSVSETEKEFETCKLLRPKPSENIDFRNYDSVLLEPSTLYRANAVKKLMQGRNYRKTWASPVKIPVVFLDTLKGGMRIVKEGGGHQTQSLRLRSADGTLYSLRSVTKNPAPLVPGIARTLGLQNIIIDGISAQHPYGALLAASLADAAGVLHTHPWMIFIPQQEFLGKYNKDYGNRLFLLEYETEGKKNWTGYKDVKEILDTDNLQELKEEGANVSIDEHALVRARLFDLLIGDWDRHAKQWGWVVQQEGERYTAIPLPGDRDNAFFDIDGIIPAIMTSRYLNPLVRPFDEDIDYMPGLVYPFDVYFLKKTPESVFVEEAEKLQQNLSDEKIRKAFEAWPDSIYELNGKEIEKKIKSRRDDLVKYAREFKKVIEEKKLLSEPLKGSEDLKLSAGLQQCFECGG